MLDTTAAWPRAREVAGASFEERLGAFEIRTVVVITALLAVIRLASLASGPWDWDEALFSLSVVGDYDIALHHPHPPGFPLYVGLARLIAPLCGAFPALQAVVALSSVAVFPLMFLVANQMGFRYRTSLISASLLATFPNAMIFGGSAFSDVPALALTLAGVLLLLRGRRSNGALLAGAVLGAAAAGVRIQSVLSLLAPGLLAARRRRFRESARAVTAGLLLVFAIYGAALAATGGVRRYGDAVRQHGGYIRAVDSFLSPTRPPLRDVLDIALRPWEAGDLGGAVLFFALIALVDLAAKRHRATALAVATFAPFFLFAWLMLDPHSMSRLSLGYMPLHAILAARGIDVAATMLSSWLLLAEGSCAIVIGASLSLSMLVWVHAPLTATTSDEPPPVAAMNWVRHNLAVNDVIVWVEGSTLAPFAQLELPGWDVRTFREWSEIDTSPVDGRRAWIVVEGRHDDAHVTFSRTERHLRQVVRDRYFDVSVISLDQTVLFGAGWYGREGSGDDAWRWMQGESTILIPGSRRSRRLHLVLAYPSDTIDDVTLTITLDGAAVEAPTRPRSGSTDITIPLPPRVSESTIAIRVTPTVRPIDVGLSRDARVLGARLLVCDVSG